MQEEERAFGHIEALEADFSRQNRVVGGGIINCTIEDGAELHAVFSIEDYTVNCIGVGWVIYAVQNHVSYGDFAEERLA